MSYDFGADEEWKNDPELRALMPPTGERTELDHPRAKKALQILARLTLQEDGYTGVEVKEDLECQLTIGGQVKTIVVDVAAFSNGVPCWIWVFTDFDRVTEEQLSEFIMWRFIAAYGHSGCTEPMRMPAMLCYGEKTLSCMCTRPIDRELIDQVAQTGQIDVSCVKYGLE